VGSNWRKRSRRGEQPTRLRV